MDVRSPNPEILGLLFKKHFTYVVKRFFEFYF